MRGQRLISGRTGKRRIRDDVHEGERNSNTASLLIKEREARRAAAEENMEEEVNKRTEEGKTKRVRHGRSIDYGERKRSAEEALVGSSHFWNRVIHDGAHESSRHPGWENNNSQEAAAETVLHTAQSQARPHAHGFSTVKSAQSTPACSRGNRDDKDIRGATRALRAPNLPSPPLYLLIMCS